MIDKTNRMLLFFLFLFTVLICGCEDKINPIENYGDDLISIHQGSKIEGQLATLKNIKNAIQIYYASNSRYPEDLKEIQTLIDSPIDPGMYEYNPQNGTVVLKGR